MTKIVFTPAHKIVELSQEQREKYALGVFDYEAIKELIVSAALEGKTRVQVTQKQPLNLENTEAVQNLQKKLRKQKYTVKWVHAAQRKDSNKSFPEISAYKELVIAWGEEQREKYKIDTGAADE